MTDVQIHWFSIINSVIVVFFLAGILSMIIVKTLRRDIARYNQEEGVRDFFFSIKMKSKQLI
jgi:transmembrane 9 superfamily protein 2/4